MKEKKDHTIWFSLCQIQKKKDELLSANEDMLSIQSGFICSTGEAKRLGILYFRHPNPWNVRNTDWVPRQRKDGWMEVIMWKFNSNYELKNDHLFVNLKLITYEGTMSGLIVRGIKFRPI
ncbi:putative phloem protein [Helianthus annuus]|nr:putative phloem protein [Helianthus annuus]